MPHLLRIGNLGIMFGPLKKQGLARRFTMQFRIFTQYGQICQSARRKDICPKRFDGFDPFGYYIDLNLRFTGSFPKKRAFAFVAFHKREA